MTNQTNIKKNFPKKKNVNFLKKFLEVSRCMNSAGAVWVRKKRQCAGVDNNHTKMLSAVIA